ncbi:GNAT family N-acetyltransferase [Nocardioides nanhaiensis]|uniref:GNAT family N-acetyltransferase n=1 Tax=Nocardioides nanhaiensis TaxID=1476871 RepID=A0ABP8WQD5_9ACTN
MTSTAAGVTLRPLTTDDIPAHAALLAACEAVDDTGEHYSAADLVEEYANPDLDPAQDIVGAWSGEELVGYALVYPRSTDGTHQRVHLEGMTHPEHRGLGIGSLLVGAMLARADAVHAERHPDLPLRLGVHGVSTNRAQEELLAEHGLVPDRWSFAMRVRLPVGAAAPPSLPEDLALHTWTPELDPALHAAHNEVFLDHPGFTPWTEVMWEQWVRGSRSFRPDVTLLLTPRDRPDHVVAYVQTSEFDAHQEATGRREAYVAKVGTRREHRGRGLAALLLGEALRRYADAGYDEAALDVDSENPTGALGLYRRAGFEVERRFTTYALVRPPLAEGGA